jgi:hypothetical protein
MGRSPYTKFSIDIRMGIDSAGENKFLEKFDSWCFRCYWWERLKTKTHRKLNVSIPIELHDFLIEKQKVEQSKNPLATIPLSKIVATAIEELKQDEEGKAASPEPAIAPIYRPEDHSAGGSSTRSTGRSRGNG